jgi:nicotinate-nucleotide adenylyltransferase
VKKPVGLLGGSFDPVHYGHLRLAMECQQQLDLEKVIFVPLNSPPHRACLQANTDQRYRMLKLATMNVEVLDVSDIEINRKGKSYTIDTLKEFGKNSGNQSLCIILGMDAFQEFDTWKDWQEITDYAHIIIANRADSPMEIRKEVLKSYFKSRQVSKKEEIHNSAAGNILRLDIPMTEISSSRIRELLHAKKSAKYLLPDNVLDFINNEQIY